MTCREYHMLKMTAEMGMAAALETATRYRSGSNYPIYWALMAADIEKMMRDGWRTDEDGTLRKDGPANLAAAFIASGKG